MKDGLVEEASDSGLSSETSLHLYCCTVGERYQHEQQGPAQHHGTARTTVEHHVEHASPVQRKLVGPHEVKVLT